MSLLFVVLISGWLMLTRYDCGDAGRVYASTVPVTEAGVLYREGQSAANLWDGRCVDDLPALEREVVS